MKDFLNIKKMVTGYASGFSLKEISIEVAQGSFTGIVGPNGSGKTTLFKAISGEKDLKQGSIFIHGQDTSKMAIKKKAQKLAIVSQNTEAADIVVEDYVLMGRMPYRKPFQLLDKKADYELVHKYMELTGTLKFKDKLMCELSGGEQQLAAIARALTQEPELLLLDEPTSHLDISHQVQVLNLIQRLNEDLNLTVLMIIHDLNLAGEYCDHLVMMKEGAIYTTGTPNEVLHYKSIEEVYHTVVITQENPLSKKPAIFLISEKVLKQNKHD